MSIDKLWEDSQVTTASSEQLQDIGFLADKAISIKEEMTALEEMLKKLGEQYRQITEKDLPEAMDAVNHAEFKTKDGRKVTVKDDVQASISKDNRPAAHTWLREHNHEELIKNQITVPLGKGLDNVATEIISELKERYGIEASREESVHASTLKAFCREQLAAGVELPAGLLGLYVRRVAVIK